MERPIVKGDRICLQCKGICHEDSVRRRVPQGFGFRSHYFCSKTCLKNYHELKFYQEARSIFVRQDRLDEFKQEMMKMVERLMEESYEFVDVITD